MSGTTTGMVCVDTKKTERVEFSRPLLRFISDAFPDLLEVRSSFIKIDFQYPRPLLQSPVLLTWDYT